MTAWTTLIRIIAMLVFTTFVSDMVTADQASSPKTKTLRVATFNVSLYDKSSGKVHDRLADGDDKQASKIAAIIQTVRPDILLINEIDYDEGGVTAKLFADKFLAVGQHDREAIVYPFVYAAPSNTGVDSGLDLNADGRLGNATDAWGFGLYSGQYSFAVLSQFPIDEKAVRTFQSFLWKDMPGAKKPIDPKTGRPFYSDEIWNALRLSSKNHVDVPIRVGEKTLHLLASHPTPPVFDGPEDRNGCRNHDEVKFWSHYIGEPDAKWMVDDQKRTGGLDENAMFVIAGDLNTDPANGDSQQQAIQDLTSDSLIADAKPKQTGDGKSMATAYFGPKRQMRIDYVLPSSNLKGVGSGIFWPKPTDASYSLTRATDHRMVWVEVQLP